MKKLGLIQSRGLGDIIIALPIARYFAQRGWHVVWPIDQRFLPSFVDAVDYVEFLPLQFEQTLDGFLMTPMRMLKERGCEKIIPLYSCLTGVSISNPAYFNSLKFDEYKYAIAGVPFGEKWNLQIKRNPEREQALYDRVVRADRYVVRQLEGSNFRAEIDGALTRQYEQVVDIEPVTDNIFDWLLILEKAAALVMIDSCFANLVDQLGFSAEKTFILRSEVRFTPVLRGNWHIRGGTLVRGAVPAVARRP